MAVVTWWRKESTWRGEVVEVEVTWWRLRALWRVSRGRMVGVPSSPTRGGVRWWRWGCGGSRGVWWCGRCVVGGY